MTELKPVELLLWIWDFSTFAYTCANFDHVKGIVILFFSPLKQFVNFPSFPPKCQTSFQPGYAHDGDFCLTIALMRVCVCGGGGGMGVGVCAQHGQWVAKWYSGLTNVKPWNSSWSKLAISSLSGGVSSAGWRVKKRSKFSASRPHCRGRGERGERERKWRDGSERDEGCHQGYYS